VSLTADFVGKNMKVIQAFLLVAIHCTILVTLGCTKKSESKVDQIMNADKGFKFPPGFPPDPGEAGKKSLEGIDSDHDGLRDDLQRWIYARYPTEPKKRAALKQLAVSYQKTLFLKHDKKEMEEKNRRTAKASRCLFDTFSIDEAPLEGEFFQAKFLNTRERTERYLEIDRWFDGTNLGPSYPRDGTACEN
jgi:hypothetical protein